MGNTPQGKKFRINPVELVIFSAISMMLVNSLYHLFYERPGYDASSWTTLEASEPPEHEKIASEDTPAFMSYDLKCDPTAQTATHAAKIRLNGMLCGQIPTIVSEGRGPASADPARITRVEIRNQANQFTATVFTDSPAGKFSTDYIPLNQGSNPIQVVFHSADGSQVAQSLQIDRD